MDAANLSKRKLSPNAKATAARVGGLNGPWLHHLLHQHSGMSVNIKLAILMETIVWLHLAPVRVFVKGQAPARGHQQETTGSQEEKKQGPHRAWILAIQYLPCVMKGLGFADSKVGGLRN